MKWPGFETGPQPLQAGEYPPEPCNGHYNIDSIVSNTGKFIVRE